MLFRSESCVSDIGVDAVKIGMIGSAATAHAVADYLERLSPSPSGEGLGWGLSPDAPTIGTAPPPTPPLKGRGLSIPIVFDPVMVATSGDVLADADTIAAFERLMRIATVVTPNLPELEALQKSLSQREREGAAQRRKGEGDPAAGADPHPSHAFGAGPFPLPLGEGKQAVNYLYVRDCNRPFADIRANGITSYGNHRSAKALSQK